MSETKSVSVRLTPAEIEYLQARAFSLSSNVAAVARELIRTGVVGGDDKALAEQLMLIERRIVILEQQSQDTNAKVEAIDKNVRKLLTTFEALLDALTIERTT